MQQVEMSCFTVASENIYLYIIYMLCNEHQEMEIVLFDNTTASFPHSLRLKGHAILRYSIWTSRA